MTAAEAPSPLASRLGTAPTTEARPLWHTLTGGRSSARGVAPGPTEPRSLAAVLGHGSSTGAAPPPTAAEEERARGYREGYEAGLAAAREATREGLDRIQASLTALAVLRADILRSSEQDLLELALELAALALGSESQDRVGFTAKMVEHSLALLADADRVTLRMSPSDLAQLEERHPGLLDNEGTLELVPDPTIKLGGVVAESALGRVDASLEHRLRELAQQLRSPSGRTP